MITNILDKRKSIFWVKKIVGGRIGYRKRRCCKKKLNCGREDECGLVEDKWGEGI